MKICQRCGHQNWTPEEKCEGCGKAFNQDGQCYPQETKSTLRKPVLTRAAPRPQSDERGNWLDYWGHRWS